MENVFIIVLFGWAMVALFIIAQLLVMAFEPKCPAVFKWRRK